MPKATLKFDLPDEYNDFRLSLDAGKMASCIIDIMNLMRTYRRYTDLKQFASADILFDKMDKEIIEIITDNVDTEIFY